MYYLNKIIGFLISPIGIAIAGLVFAVVLSWIKRVRLAKWIGGVTVIWLWLWMTPLMTRFVGAPLEREFLVSGRVPAVEGFPEADAIVLLGGGMGVETNLSNYAEMWSGADRVWQAARLWKAGKAPKIIATGDGARESTLGLLKDFGVDEKCVEFLDARNTEEEARGVGEIFECRVESLELGVSDESKHHCSTSTLNFDSKISNAKLQTSNSKLNLLYLGRRHPLKGVEYLEEAVVELGGGSRSRESKMNSGIGNFSNVEGLSVHCSTSTSNFDSKQVELKIVSDAFGEEKERIWDWCDVLVLPTLSDNFGLVIAETLERGKRVITTDGAPVWGEGLNRVERVERVEGGEILSGYEGRLIYLKGYREGSGQKRVELLKKAIVRVGEGEGGRIGR